ncbi:MAG: hypothetical protein GX433_11660 [Deltaproteobacteria bacterium]|jgi:trk system potassium uptake protein TrkH|nr:hypothetical protein [Deltaproteobacteria bacterium]
MRISKHLSPSIYPILGFLSLILLGTVVLEAIPLRRGSHLPLIDSLFMVTSAVCVTGLSVIDIGKEFTVWGQVTIMLLIQMGGLGIMTFSTVLLLVLGRSISFRSRFVVQDIFTHSPQADLYVLLRRVILFTFSFEAAGSFLLFSRFHQQFDSLKAWYYAVFHSISAFCNAGFSLFPDSFMGYRDDALVNLTIMALIVFGGIGFMVMHELVRAAEQGKSRRQYWIRLSLHTKMVLCMTATLLVGGTIFFLVSEWSTTLKELPFSTKLLASFFQSVTPRTAGFNTLDYASMNNITLLGTVMLMFIGASPGSTGGGIKTSTLGVLLALSRARLKGSADHVHAFKRSIVPTTVNRAFGIFVISVAIVLIGTACMLISQVGSIPHKESSGQFMELFFETTSAFGTVGLSLGITPGLTGWSKFILVLMMFTGRLGPLVIAMAIQAEESKGRFYYAQEPIMIG